MRYVKWNRDSEKARHTQALNANRHPPSFSTSYSPGTVGQP